MKRSAELRLLEELATPLPEEPPRRPIYEREGYADPWDAITAMRRCQHRVEVAIDQALSSHAVTFAQYRALVLLSERPSYISYLARQLRVTRQAANAVLTKLEMLGLVERTSMGHVTEVEITPLGRTQLTKLRTLVSKLVAHPIGGVLTARELFVLTRLLEQIDLTVRPNASPTWWLDD